MKYPKQTTPYSCGAVTFSFLINKKLTPSKEVDLHSKGMVDGTKAFLAPSFSKLLNLTKDKGKFEGYVTQDRLSKKALTLMADYENVSFERKRVKKWMKEVQNSYNNMLSEAEFNLVDNNKFVNTLKKLLINNKKVGLLTMMPLMEGEPEIPHWVSVIGYDSKLKTFQIGHSWKGKIINLEEDKLLDSLKRLDNIGFGNQMVVYEK